jgi:DNA (cytosine-5)-methyltransferase 1
VQAAYGTGGGNVPMVMESINGEIAGTLDASYYKGCGERQGVEREVVCVGNGQLAQAKISDKVGALNCMHDQQAVITYSSSAGALCTDDYKGPNRQYVGQDKLQINGSVVRRLTPLECERLQGFPDHWTDIGDWVDSKGKKHKGESDSPRYKALGNSIALPFWQWMAGRMVKQLKQD